MASSNSTLLLTRLLSLKEKSPLFLAVDSLAQSAAHFTTEFVSRLPDGSPVVYLSFETLNKPKYATQYIECLGKSLDSITKDIQLGPEMTVVIVDSFNYIPTSLITKFVQSIVRPSVVLYGVYHTDIPEATQRGYPSSMRLLQFMATSIFEIRPNTTLDEEELERYTEKLRFPAGLNSQSYFMTLLNRRKSGRSILHRYLINGHDIEPYVAQKDEGSNEEDLLRDLTTFNLTTSQRQKHARQEIELPFMVAQNGEGAVGGAIVYEYEKDDDYDEEDPYEDPF